MKRIQNILFTTVISFFVFATLSCSVVFTAKLTGVVVDKDDYNNSLEDPGINDVEVYLYLKEEDRNTDYSTWESDSSLPEEAEEKLYDVSATSTIEPTTGMQGVFTFDTVVWNNLFPKYGNSEDIREIYLLLYHANYGMTKYSTKIVADADNTIGPIPLERVSDRQIRYGGQLQGLVWYDLTDSTGTGAPDGQYNSGEEISGAEIKLWVDTEEDPGSADPDYATYSMTTSASGTVQNGVFAVDEVLWNDTMNAERYSAVTCYMTASYPDIENPLIDPDSDAEQWSGYITMYSNTVTFITIELE